MAFPSVWSWVPRPKSFLGLISLQTGTEMVTLTLIINKLTGFYGLLAILTGYSLSLLQLSMYLYSLAVLLTLVACFPHIRRQSPFEVLSLAWLYGIDTLLNAAYTAAFALDWFAHSTALDRHAAAPEGEPPANPAVPDATLAEGTPVTPDVPKTETGRHIGPEESWTSLALIVVVTAVRLYFALVVMAFARQALSRRDEAAQGWGPEDSGSSSKLGGASEPLFARGTSQGEGWRGDLGRRMLSCGRSYWLGERGADEWDKSAGSKFRNGAAQV